MSRWSVCREQRRGQVEPLAAIVAVFALGAGLTVYAGVLDGTLPGSTDRNVAQPALGEVEQEIERHGVVDPDQFGAGAVNQATPGGYEMNVTLETDHNRWQLGPQPPAAAMNASERVSVSVGEGQIRPGRLVVKVWR